MNPTALELGQDITRHSYALRWNGSSIEPMDREQYLDYCFVCVQEAEILVLRRESNRIYSPLRVAIAMGLVMFAATPFLMLAGLVAAIQRMREW